MKRSEINAIMRGADEFIRGRGFYLPPFAYWPVETWEKLGHSAIEILETGLGWDITDFGWGDFYKAGLFLFTVRNGKPSAAKKGKQYCEKIMVVEHGQVTPFHFHWNKMEDIINRGGGKLRLHLFNSTSDEQLDQDTPVQVTVDGLARVFEPGETLELAPGESVTLPPLCYHEFWGEGRVLVGEVSLVNDDSRDNRFLNAPGRFPEIEEDEAPLHLLVSDYNRIFGGMKKE